mmetsp:Transcript_13788/g.41625  ORF Transcript_13788/g.41625 Transcript_13788/m.41625 type:complete len:205 (-) Transcript_13788:77-691(-)
MIAVQLLDMCCQVINPLLQNLAGVIAGVAGLVGKLPAQDGGVVPVVHPRHRVAPGDDCPNVTLESRPDLGVGVEVGDGGTLGPLDVLLHAAEPGVSVGQRQQQPDTVLGRLRHQPVQPIREDGLVKQAQGGLQSVPLVGPVVEGPHAQHCHAQLLRLLQRLNGFLAAAASLVGCTGQHVVVAEPGKVEGPPIQHQLGSGSHNKL